MLLKTLGIKTLEIEITSACNFHCSYCYHDPSCQNGKLMSPEIVNAIIKLLSVNPQIHVYFMGGEPLLAVDIIKSIVTSVKAESFGLTSNMSLYDERTAGFFNENRISLNCSIDGCRTAHDKNRHFQNGNPTFETVKKGIQIALGTQPHSSARATLLPNNVEYFYESVVDLFSMGLKRITFTPELNRSDWRPGHWDLYYKNLVKAGMFISENPSLYLRNIKDGLRILYHRRENRCDAGFSMLAVSVNGDLFPCHRFTSTGNSELNFGNLLRNTMDYSRLERYRQAVRSSYKICSTCRNFRYCKMSCPSVNLERNNDINKVNETYCEYIEYSRRACIELVKELHKTKKTEALVRMVECHLDKRYVEYYLNEANFL